MSGPTPTHRPSPPWRRLGPSAPVAALIALVATSVLLLLRLLAPGDGIGLPGWLIAASGAGVGACLVIFGWLAERLPVRPGKITDAD
jgi:hypothetical protein